eukprot:2309999-Heterocapsa_arctica.AAC.1
MHAAYQHGSLSLPSGSAGAVRLLDIGPPDLHAFLVDDIGLLRATDEAARQLEEEAMDTKLAPHGHEYGHFLSELFDKGILEKVVLEQ